MEFFLIRFVYSGLVFCDPEGLTTERSTLRKSRKPLINGTMNFNSKFLKTDATLKRTDDPIIHSLFKNCEKNELIWNCHHPKAKIEVLYKGKIYKGFGYSETLFSTIKPWDLPIDELKWGRFLSDSYTLIWIYWKGKYPLNKMFLNGIEYNDAVFEKNSVIFGNSMYHLKFSEIQVIRQGKLSGLFSKMKLIKIFFSSRILNTVEIKYRAKATLSKNSIVLSNDWSLFEIVTWGK